MKNPKCTFYREFNYEYLLQVCFDDITVTSFIDIKFGSIPPESSIPYKDKPSVFWGHKNLVQCYSLGDTFSIYMVTNVL